MPPPHGSILLVDDRPEIGVVAEPDAQAVGSLHELVTEFVVDAIHHDDARTRRAPLTGVRERRRDRPLDRAVEIRVVAHDECVLSAELETDLGEPAAGALLDPAAGLRLEVGVHPLAAGDVA